MFTNKRYAQALVAFQRAGRSQEVAICHAFLLRENARVIPDDQARERTDAFGEAGEAFHTCAKATLPDQKKERLAYYANAADCFARGNRWKGAGDCYLQLEQYSKAARAYREGAQFDEMVEVLERHERQIEPNLLVQLRKVAQMNYFKVSESSTIKKRIN
jgi:tetratricopeptide (TPR) repeat protein